MAKSLSESFPSLESLLDSNPEQLRHAGANRAQIEALLDKKTLEHARILAEKELATAQKLDVGLLVTSDKAYPRLLKLIPDPPPILYFKGAIPKEIPNVACVGTREPTEYGRVVTERITEFFSQNGFGIVSGLALGVDTIAHETALKNGAWCCAVLANGLDSIYPSKNKGLANRILDLGGTLISESRFNQKALASNLIRRDRIQSGLSLAVIPMQTDLDGGTMHTIRFALIQKRAIFCPVAPQKFSDENKNRGINALLQDETNILNDVSIWPEKWTSEFLSRKGHGPLARPIYGRENYNDVLSQIRDLEEKLVLSL